MSGANDKNSKINRLLLRQRGDRLDILEVLRLSREMQDLQRRRIHDQTGALVSIGNSLKLATETAARLEAENARLRKYLGSELFARRQRDAQIPTMQVYAQRLYPRPKPICSCAPGICGGTTSSFSCRHGREAAI